MTAAKFVVVNDSRQVKIPRPLAKIIEYENVILCRHKYSECAIMNFKPVIPSVQEIRNNLNI